MSVYLLWGAFCYFLWRAMIEWQQNWDQYCASYSSFNITHFNLIYVQQQLGTNHMTQIPFIFFICPFFHYTNNTIETNIIHMAGGQTRIQTFNILWKLLQFTNLQLHFLKVWQTKRHFTFWARMRNCEKRQLATSCVCLSVRPPAWNWAPTGRIFMKFDMWGSFENAARKARFMKMTKITGILHEDRRKFMLLSHWILLRMRNVSDKTCRENQNTHFMFSENRAVYEITCKNTVQTNRPQMAI